MYRCINMFDTEYRTQRKVKLMKKTRKVLSLVLAIAFVFSSMPFVYTGTAAADAVTYSSGTGTVDNPTRPVEASGVLEYQDIIKMNINSQSTSYTFYQTIDDEYFTFGQTQGIQQYNGDYDASSRTLTFEGIEFYSGETSLTNPVLDETHNIYVNEPSNGIGEEVVITNNPTSEYLSKYHISSTWTASNSNAQGVAEIPFVLQGSSVDFSGCRVYTWQNDIVFHGHSTNESGEINTGYYEQLKWNWVSDDSSANFTLRIGTTIRVLDARELAKEIAEAENILANPENYTDAYISSVEATLNTIPDDLRDFSAVYDQSVIDAYTEMLQDVSLNSADYTEFNKVYSEAKNMTNSDGDYSAESFAAFQAKVAEINTNLPKNLDKTQQETVDVATQAIVDAYELLVVVGTQTSGSNYSETLEDLTITVGNDFKFVQVKDDQAFFFTQPWTLVRGDKSSDRRFNSVLTTSDSSTNTFISKLNSSSILTGQTISGNAVEDDITNATIFQCWEEVDSSGTVNTGSSVIDTSTGVINSGYSGFGKGKTYYLQNSPVFTGMSADVTGEQTYTYNQTIYVSYFSWGNKYYNTNFNTTLTITDARQLLAAVEDAKETLANPGTHSEAYITALQAAVDSIPDELIRGVEYYTQAEVDQLYSDITTIPEEVGDYSEFVEVFEMMTSLNKDKYTEDSYDTFLDEIYAINQGLAKNLTADQQATIDATVDSLYAAYDKLVSAHLNDDDVFTQNDISETGNSPLEFSVSSTQYNFMQTVDGQKFAIRTVLTARNSKTRYTCNLLSLGFSTVAADTVASICEARETPDAGCHNGEAVTLNQTEIVVNAVSGVNVYSAADDAGDIAEHNTWVNTEGVALSTSGVLNDPTTLSTSDSSAYAEMYYTGVSDNQESFTAQVDASYAFRLGWSYYETVLGVQGDTIRRHAHIPVNIKITDVRALHSLYGEVEEIMSGVSEANYTFESLVNLYNVYQATDSDVANGNVYVDQETANAQYAELKAAYDALQEGADYSEYFEAYVKAQEIIESGNDDGYGNKLYDDATYNKLVDKVTTIHNELDKNLSATDENQETIDFATLQINEAVDAANASKRADYTALEEAIIEAEKIVEAEDGTYTEATLDVLKQVLNDANNLDRNLYASQQETVDAITSALEAAIADMEFKADYSEYDEAYNKVKDIIDNPDKYTKETVDAAEAAMETSGAIDKDLADTAANRQTISDATDAMNEVLANKQEKANYDEFNTAYEQIENIVNNPDDYTAETVEAAQQAKDVADALGTDQPATNQDAVNSVIDAMNQVITNAQEKADYTDYNNAKTEADNLVNDDGNGNPIYDEEAFQQYQDAVAEIDGELDNNLPSSEQETVDDAAQALKDLRTELDATKGYEETIIDPETTADKLTEDVIQNGGYNADEVIIEFKDYTGKELAGADFVGTGSTVRVILKSTGELLEYKMFIVMGDVDGDGDVDETDYQKSVEVCLEKETYPEENYYFFTANDMDADGVIDVIDVSFIRLTIAGFMD